MFDGIHWGSLTEQLKRYNQAHKTKYTLETFSKMVLAQPNQFHEKTIKRARFYLNIIKR
jgi:hypothetical protein